MGVSEARLYERFRRESTCGPAEWIRHQSIRLAQNYLMSGYNVAETAERLRISSRWPEVDTLYFLYDGAPAWGQVEDWPQIHSALLLMCWHRPIAGWAVAFQAGKNNAIDMRRLSYANFGLFEEL